MTTIFGGPNVYKGKNMTEAHKHLNLSDDIYDTFCEILVQVVLDFKVDEAIVREIAIILE